MLLELEPDFVHKFSHEEKAGTSRFEVLQWNIEIWLGYEVWVKGLPPIPQMDGQCVRIEITRAFDFSWPLPTIAVFDNIGAGFIHS